MTEYDCLLKVEYFLYEYSDKGECIFGVGPIQNLIDSIGTRRIVVALDQASNKTGVCILDFDTKELIGVMDLINSGFPSKQLYFESIYAFLANHIKDANIVHFIYEIPVEHSKNMRTLAILESLRAFIADFKYRMPSLNEHNMVEINVTAWRGHFLADKKYDGRRKLREDAKESTREEVCERYPILESYAYKRSEPPDSCDAVGIALGALEEMYSKTFKDCRKVNKTMPIKNNKHYFKVRQGTLSDFSNLLKTEYFQYEKYFEVLEYNGEMTLEENAKRYCCNNDKLGILLVSPSDVKTNQLLKWETGKDLNDSEYYAVFCRRA